MNLLAPAALAFAAVAAPIVAMYVLKMRRPARVVPSTFLWERALHDVQANAPWQRLRPNLLLLLQLLAVAALVLALARPYVLRAATAQGDVVVVLDGSTLMTATDIAPSRFSAAKARIAELIDGLGSNNVMSIVLMARHPHVLIAQSADRAALHAALDRAAPTDEAPDPAAALAVAGALSRTGRQAGIYLYIAAGGPATPTAGGPASDVHVIALGGTLRDLGIVAFAASRGSDGTVAILARVANLGRRYAASDLQLDIATGDPTHLTWHRQVDLRPIALNPGASTVIVRAQLPANTTAAEARLTTADDLAADNTAWAAVPVPAPRRVLLVTNTNAILSLALSLAAGVRVDQVTPAAYTPATARGADLAVFDQWLPPSLPATAVLAVGPPASRHSPLGLPVSAAEAASALEVGDDPYGLLCTTCLSGVAVDQAATLGVPPWAYAVLQTGGRPVLVAGQVGTRRIAALGFPVFDSNWPLLPGFPIVIQNLLNWLAPPVSAPVGIYHPGDDVVITPAPNATALSVIDPSGHAVGVAPAGSASTQPVVQPTRPGLYTVAQQTPAGERRALFAVNSFPIAQRSAAPVRSGSGQATSRVGRAEVPVELAPLVAVVALLVLAGEWWVAARRR